MNETKNLHYIKHAEIDAEKWDRCIDEADNCRFYAYTWQLDRVIPSWDALVLGDYGYVMPLPVKSMVGIKFLIQPMFSQQLGIFPTPPKEISNLFYTQIRSIFRYASINLNSGNLPGKGMENLQFNARKNYLLPLGNDYSTIASFFSKNTKRNIVKAENANLTIIEGIRLEAYLEFKEKLMQPGVPRHSLKTLKSMIAYGQYKGFGEIYGVYSPGNELCAAVYFCRWKDRVIYYNAASNQEGKDLNAMHFLVNRFILQNAGRDLTLDFEGSMIPGVARFYAGFGATPETYFQLQMNRLPLPLRWIKR